MGYNFNYYYYHSSIPYSPKVGFGPFGVSRLKVADRSVLPRMPIVKSGSPSANSRLWLKQYMYPQSLSKPEAA